MLKPLACALLAASFWCTDATAEAADGVVPVLRADVVVADELVRIRDLVDNAGASGDIPVFRAPDLGQVGAVPTARVVHALAKHQLGQIDTKGITEISVARAARTFSRRDIENRVAAALNAQPGLAAAELALTFDREVRTLDVEPTAGDLRTVRAHYEPSTSRFDVSFEIPGSEAAKRLRLHYTGTAILTTEVAVLTRPIARGEVIRASDLLIERRPKAAIPGGAMDTVERITGLAARRTLQVGQPLRASDLMKPELVRQNEPVTITYEMPGLLLSLRGKALNSGAEGDVVEVLNIQSKRTVQAVVTGPARVTLMVNDARAAGGTVTGSLPPASSQRIE